MKYTFFYPENDERLSPDAELEFLTVEDASLYWLDRRTTWREIPTQSSQDEAAFTKDSDGSIVVVRAIVDSFAEKLNALLSRREAVLTLRTYYEKPNGESYDEDEYAACLEVYRGDDLHLRIEEYSTESSMDALIKLLEKCEGET